MGHFAIYMRNDLAATQKSDCVADKFCPSRTIVNHLESFGVIPQTFHPEMSVKWR